MIDFDLDTTFADDSYKSWDCVEKIVVTAQIPLGFDIRWFHELKVKLRIASEIKYSHLKNAWNDLGSLRAAIEKGISLAVIAISDPIEMGLPRCIDQWPPDFKREAEKLLIRRIYDCTYMPELTKLMNGTAFTISFPSKAAETQNDKIRPKINNLHNMKLFACRINCAFSELYDKANWESAYNELLPFRFIKYYLIGNIISDYQPINRAFDDGNRPSVNLIDQIRKDLSTVLPEINPFWSRDRGKTYELNSRNDEHVQISDIAAGRARELYGKSDGKKKLKDLFKAVIINGHLI